MKVFSALILSWFWFWALFSHVSATLKLISQWDVLTFNYSWCFIVGQTLHRHIDGLGKRDHLTVEFWSLQRNLNYKVAIGGVTSDLDTVLFPYTQDQFHQRKWWLWWELAVSCTKGQLSPRLYISGCQLSNGWGLACVTIWVVLMGEYCSWASLS